MGKGNPNGGLPLITLDRFHVVYYLTRKTKLRLPWLLLRLLCDAAP